MPFAVGSAGRHCAAQQPRHCGAAAASQHAPDAPFGSRAVGSSCVRRQRRRQRTGAAGIERAVGGGAARSIFAARCLPVPHWLQIFVNKIRYAVWLMQHSHVLHGSCSTHIRVPNAAWLYASCRVGLAPAAAAALGAAAFRGKSSCQWRYSGQVIFRLQQAMLQATSQCGHQCTATSCP